MILSSGAFCGPDLLLPCRISSRAPRRISLPTSSPLIWRGAYDSKLYAQLHIAINRKRLCHNVRNLIFGWARAELNCALLHLITNEMVPQIDIFASFVLNRVLCYCNSRGIVTKQLYFLLLGFFLLLISLFFFFFLIFETSIMYPML